MTANEVQEIEARQATHHVLGHPADLDGHVRAHGSLTIGRRHRPSTHLLDALEASGLLGRGGGGFPPSAKLAVIRRARPGGTVLVNAMEGEPASDKDKVLLSHVPHLVLDGAQYVAFVARARQVVVCVPAGRDAVASAVARAIEERRRARHNPIEEVVTRPPDRYVAGEESALVNFVKAGVANPTFRPDKGSPLIIGRRPALVHNAETLAHIALIARYGSGGFRARGLLEEPGTCLVTIGGHVAHPGVVEVDLGTPLRDIVERARPDPAQAYLVGGYGGSWVGREGFATPYSGPALRNVGAVAGVGVVVVLRISACGITDTARILRYLAQESAGQCGPCVFGLPSIAHDFALLALGRVDAQLMDRLEGRLEAVSGRGACRHPDGAVRLAKSALRVFASDVAAHQRGDPCAFAGGETSMRFPYRVT